MVSPVVATAPAVTASPSRACRVLSASYGGRKTVLIRTETAAETQLTALTVVEGFERSMIDNYKSSRAPGGQTIGEFVSAEAAMARARELCPGTT